MAKKSVPAPPKKTTPPQVKEQKSPELETPAKSRLDPTLIAIMLVAVCVALIRLGLVDIPLERDEGEYAYIGKLILEGVAPYKSAYNMKLPGTYAMYALIMSLFGATISGIHLGLLVVNVATLFFFIFGFRRLYNSSIAFFAASVGSSRVDLQACKLEYSIVSPK